MAGISAEKVIQAYDTYTMISEVLTEYRKTRRNSNKEDFARYLNVDYQKLLDHIEEFRYMNTGDIILMNGFANLKRKYEELSVQEVGDREIVVDAIFIIRDIIKNESEMNTALLTKNNSVFGKVQKKIQELDKRYQIVL